MSVQHHLSTTSEFRAERSAMLDAMELLTSAAIWLSERTATEGARVPPAWPQAPPTRAPALSPREREVAALMARGCSNRQIGETLSISIATAERHASNIFNKLGVRSRSQVAVWAVFEGLAHPGTG
jgi:DNA-binding NarL/FixJ family response regulator